MAYNVDFANAEYHQILPNLFLGGHMWIVPTGEVRDGQTVYRYQHAKHSTVSTDPSWDYVVSAFVALDDEELRAIPQCDTRMVLFNDTEDGLSEQTWARIKDVVEEITARWILGQKVLVRCQAGYNRSGMITCLVLMRLGFTAEDAIQICRKRRGKDVLINAAFEKYVREHEQEYRNPTNLPVTEAIAGEWLALLK